MKKRWKVVIDYGLNRTETTHIEELEELHNIIERGPDWNLIVSITITLQRKREQS